jgi:hypothetical protein
MLGMLGGVTSAVTTATAAAARRRAITWDAMRGQRVGEGGDEDAGVVRQDRASCCRKGGDPVSSIKLLRQSFQALRLGSLRQTEAAWQMELTRAVPQVAGEKRAGEVGAAETRPWREKRGPREWSWHVMASGSVSVSVSVGMERGVKATTAACDAAGLACGASGSVRQCTTAMAITWRGC